LTYKIRRIHYKNQLIKFFMGPMSIKVPAWFCFDFTKVHKNNFKEYFTQNSLMFIYRLTDKSKYLIITYQKKISISYFML